MHVRPKPIISAERSSASMKSICELVLSSEVEVCEATTKTGFYWQICLGGTPIPRRWCVSIEIGCPRRDEIRCPRSHEITHHLRGTAVPSMHICHLSQDSRRTNVAISSGISVSCICLATSAALILSFFRISFPRRSITTAELECVP